MSAQLVLQLTALSNASLEPDEDELGDIKGISTAGQIPYEDSRRKPLSALRHGSGGALSGEDMGK